MAATGRSRSLAERPCRGSSATAVNAALNVSTSTEYAAGRPRWAITNPPIAGPATSVVWNSTMLSESAPGEPVQADQVRNDRGAGGSVDGADECGNRHHRIDLEQRWVTDECSQGQQA